PSVTVAGVGVGTTRATSFVSALRASCIRMVSLDPFQCTSAISRFIVAWPPTGGTSAPHAHAWPGAATTVATFARVASTTATIPNRQARSTFMAPMLVAGAPAITCLFRAFSVPRAECRYDDCFAQASRIARFAAAAAGPREPGRPLPTGRADSRPRSDGDAGDESRRVLDLSRLRRRPAAPVVEQR